MAKIEIFFSIFLTILLTIFVKYADLKSGKNNYPKYGSVVMLLGVIGINFLQFWIQYSKEHAYFKYDNLNNELCFYLNLLGFWSGLVAKIEI